jgi:predicted small metal-binding protein
MKVWTETLDIKAWRKAHGGKRREYGGTLIDNLTCPVSYCVLACGFTFRLSSLAEIEEYIAHFERKTHPSTREYFLHCAGHYDTQTKFTRLPARLNTKGRRPQVAAALRRALEIFQKPDAGR